MTGNRAGALIMAVPFAAGSILLFSSQRRAGANSAPAYWEGAQSAGALLAGDECPIAVEKELLTVNIPEFPPLGGEKEEFDGYGASVTAQYTFRNPTETDYTATLLFPFGYAPEYAPYEYNFYDDTARYTITENGSAVEITSRHSFCGDDSYGSGFDVEKEIDCLEGAGESFYTADTPVTEHVFHVTTPAAAGGHANYVSFCIKLKADPAKTRIATSQHASCFIENGLALIVYNFAQTEGGFDFSLYAFGEDVIIKKQAVYDNRITGALLEDASAVETAKTEGTYAAFVAGRYPGAESGMSEEDWRRGFTEAMGIDMYSTDGMMCSAVPDEIDAADFMRWYEYRLQFPAGETVVNEVSAPIYPTVRGSGKKTQYDYTYLLSPARKWASFGSLRVELKTPYYLAESSLDFQKTEEGYVLDWEDGLPLGELTFTLSEEAPNAISGFMPYRGEIDPVSLGVIIFLVVLAVGTIAVTVGIVLVRRKRETASARGTAEEGKVDLPAPPDTNDHDDNNAGDGSG